MEDHFYDSRTYSGLTATLNAADAAAYMNGGRRPTFSDVGVSPEKYLRAYRLALRRPRCSRRKPVLHALTHQRRASIPLAKKSGIGTSIFEELGIGSLQPAHIGDQKLS
jgi:hypothetical protein